MLENKTINTRSKRITRRMNLKLQKLLEVPVIEQRSPEWFEARLQSITSSEAASVLGQSHYENATSVLFKKFGVCPKFKGNMATAYGIQHEEKAIALYCASMRKKQHEVGLIRYDQLHGASEFHMIAGSPDGIASYIDDESREPLMLEFKVPYRRKIIPSVVPEHYVSQVQLNMFICDLEYAEFVEWKPEPFYMNIVRVQKDRHWLSQNLPVIQEFHKEIVKYQNVGIENHPEYAKYLQKSMED